MRKGFSGRIVESIHACYVALDWDFVASGWAEDRGVGGKQAWNAKLTGHEQKK